MTEKTVEELTAELNELKKINLEREIASEKEKNKQVQEELARQAREKLKEEIKTEMGFTQKSKLDENNDKQSMNLTGNRDFENFKASWIRSRANRDGIKVKGLPYAEIMDNLVNGEYARKGE